MSEPKTATPAFKKVDPIEECTTYFNTQRQARLSEADIRNDLHRLKKVALQLGLSDENELLSQAHKGNAKSIAAMESLLLRPHPGFFEGPGMYKSFENILLPQLINQNNAQKKISIWVPGCTQGQEAYSLALLLHNRSSELRGWDLSICATDTDSNVLKQAEKATFDMDDIDEVILKLYGSGLKKNGYDYIIQSSVRELITFQHNNFYDTNPEDNKYDVIVFRDHLKHWQPDMQERIIKNFEKSLNPHGCLILSYEESLMGLSSNFTPMGTTQGFYQKI